MLNEEVVLATDISCLYQVLNVHDVHLLEVLARRIDVLRLEDSQQVLDRISLLLIFGVFEGLIGVLWLLGALSETSKHILLIEFFLLMILAVHFGGILELAVVLKLLELFNLVK